MKAARVFYLLTILVLLVPMSLALTACGATEEPTEAQPAAPTQPPPEKPTDAPTAVAGPSRGGWVVTAIEADPDTLNLATTTNATVADVAGKIFDGLVWRDRDLAMQPGLAESWTISTDGKVYTFKLRAGVTWHDGQPFTSADVKYTMEEILGKLHPRTQQVIQRVESIETPDELTVIFTLGEPYAPFLLQLNTFEAPILPMHIYADAGDVLENPANLAPIGTGPFKFSEWEHGSSIRLERNENYFEEGLPYLDGIVFQISPEPATRVAALEAGEIQFLGDWYLPKTEVARLEANSELESARGMGNPQIYFLMMNTETEALSTVEARQAIAFAVDRERMVAQAGGGIGRVGRGPFGDGFPALVTAEAEYDQLYPRSVAEATDLLDSAGVAPAADGSRGTLRLVYATGRSELATAAEIVRENLMEIGFNVDVQPLEFAVAAEKVFQSREYDLAIYSYTSSGDPAIGYHRIYHTDTSRSNFTNASGYSNAQVDELLDQALTTPDDAKRTAIYHQVLPILATEVPTLVLWDAEQVCINRVELHGLHAGIEWRDRWELAWLGEE